MTFGRWHPRDVRDAVDSTSPRCGATSRRRSLPHGPQRPCAATTLFALVMRPLSTTCCFRSRARQARTGGWLAVRRSSYEGGVPVTTREGASIRGKGGVGSDGANGVTARGLGLIRDVRGIG